MYIFFKYLSLWIFNSSVFLRTEFYYAHIYTRRQYTSRLFVRLKQSVKKNALRFLEAICITYRHENMQDINILDPGIPRFQFYFCHISAQRWIRKYVKMAMRGEIRFDILGQPENRTTSHSESMIKRARLHLARRTTETRVPVTFRLQTARRMQQTT